jgi:adenosylmethionine-8-amino-7-oxononanoate aminotransferase
MRPVGMYLWDNANKDIIQSITEHSRMLTMLICVITQIQTVKQLGEEIIDLLHDDMEKIYLTCTGSESNELAIKLARKYHQLKGNKQKRKIGVWRRLIMVRIMVHVCSQYESEFKMLWSFF